MKTFLALTVSTFAVFFFAGCSETHATDEHAESHHAHTACAYKEGRGLQLTAAAAKFAGIEVADFTGELPASALLRTVRGDFVFVENDGWFLRTPADHLYEGDRVVVSGVRTLWLAELQAVNGGVGCADGH